MLRRILFVGCALFLSVWLWTAPHLVTAQSGEEWDYYCSQQLDTTMGADVALGDLDGDGDLDAYVANGDGWSQADRIWINQGGEQEGIAGELLAGALVGEYDGRAVALGDVDNDGDLDALVVHNNESNRVWLNDGDGQFLDSAQDLGYGPARDVALGDLDMDGDLDAFIVYDDGQPDTVWLNNGAGIFADSGQALGTTTSRAVALEDLNADGYLDAFVATNGDGHRVWLNDGEGAFTQTSQSLTLTWKETYDVALGDLDEDGYLDAVVARAMDDEIWYGLGGGQFEATPHLVGENESTGVALGDIDLDGRLDVVFANDGNEPTRIWLNNGSGEISDSGRFLGASYSRAVALGDLNGDGGLDAVVANSNDQADEVYLMVNAPTSVTLRHVTVSGRDGSVLPAVALLAALTLLLGRRRLPGLR
jgi:hypothetical protein